MHKTTPILLRLIRTFFLFIQIASGCLQALIYPYFPQYIQRRMMRHWSSGLLATLNVRLRCTGKLPGVEIPRALLVANHISWLDVCVLMAACPTRFVAKSEIDGWPVLGFLSRQAGTLFIKRARRSDTLRINQQIGDVLEKGEKVVIFPEGTTADGTYLNHFHASLLQSAIDADALLFPVAITYRRACGEVCPEAAYTDSSLVLSLRKILSQTEITVELTFLEPVTCGMRNRRELARLSEQAIAETLSLPIPHKKTEKPYDLPAE